MYCDVCLKWTDYDKRRLCARCITVVDMVLPMLIGDFRRAWREELMRPLAHEDVSMLVFLHGLNYFREDIN